MSLTTTSDLIAAAQDRLTPSERRIATAVLDDPTLLAFGTVSDLAQRCETSRPTIVRFAHTLGFDGYSDLQQHVRRTLAMQLSRPSQRIRSRDAAVDAARDALDSALRFVLHEMNDERLRAFVAPLTEARRVWILSGETSRAGAHALDSGLSMLLPEVSLVDDHDVGRVLGAASDADVAVVFDFVRYRRTIQLAASALAEVGVTIVAVTDGPLSPLVGLSDVWCQVEVPAVGPFDTSVPAVAAAELIIAQVASELPEEATRRIDSTEAMWQATGTFVDQDAVGLPGR